MIYFSIQRNFVGKTVKHKLLKLVSGAVVLTLLWQRVGWCYADFLRARAFEEREKEYTTFEKMLLAEVANRPTLGEDIRIAKLLVVYPHGNVNNNPIQLCFEVTARTNELLGSVTSYIDLYLYIPSLKRFKELGVIKYYHLSFFDNEWTYSSEVVRRISEIIWSDTGNLVEVKINDLVRKPIDVSHVEDPSFWTGWNWDPFRESLTYRVIDRVCASNLKPLIERMKLKFGKIILLDIFAGTGLFVERVYEEAGLGYDITSYLIERNSANCRYARERLGRTARNATVIEAELGEGKGQVLARLPERPNLVTSIGGIDESVVKREDAFTVAKQVYNLLPEGGIFVVSGFTYCLLDKEDFESIGFIVEQMTIPKNIFKETPAQFYVLIKPLKRDGIASYTDLRLPQSSI